VNKTRIGGVSFMGWLGLTFIILKLSEVIDWSWWWVLLPLYGPITLALILFIVGATLVGSVSLFDDAKNRKPAKGSMPFSI